MITKNSAGQALSQAFLNAVAQPIINYDMQLYSVVTGEQLAGEFKRATLQMGAGEAINDYSDLTLGEVYTSVFNADIYDSPLEVGDEVEVRVGVEVSEDTYEYVSVAYITITSCKVFAGVSTVEGVGRISSKFNVAAGLGDSDMMAADLAAALSMKTGVTVSLGGFEETAQTVTVTSSMTCREALVALALRLGGFAAEVEGGVVVSPFSSAGVYAMPEGFMTLAPQLQQEQYTITGLTINAAENTFTYGDGQIKADDASATGATAAITWTNLEAVPAYTSGLITAGLADPRVTPLDWVQVSYEDVVYVVPARGISTTFDGGYFGSYAAAGLSSIAADSMRTGPLGADVDAAKTAAQEAKEVATATNQHFWYADDGAHVTQATRQEFLANPTGGNLLENSFGMLLRDGDTYLASYTQSNAAFYDGKGNEDSNITALFGADKIRMGYADKPNFQIGAADLTGYNADSVPFFNINLNGGSTVGTRDFDIGTSQAESTILWNSDVAQTLAEYTVEIPTGATEVTWGDASTLTLIASESAFPINVQISGSTYYSGFDSGTADRTNYFAQMTYHLGTWTLGSENTFTANAAISFQVRVGASAAVYPIGEVKLSITEGEEAITVRVTYEKLGGSPYITSSPLLTSVGCLGKCVAVTTAPSFTFGSRTGTAGMYSIAGGENVSASGNGAMAFGESVAASADNSTALGLGTTAMSIQQTVLGAYNRLGTDPGGSIRGDYALIVGNGTDDDNRSNAATIDWNGSATLGGDMSEEMVGLQFKTANYTDLGIQVYDNGTTYGHNMLIQSGGLLIMGGGEYPVNRYALSDVAGADAEQTYIGSDTQVFIETNANTIANRHTWNFTNGTINTPPIRGTSINNTSMTSRVSRSVMSINDKDGNVIGQIQGAQETTNARIGLLLGGRRGSVNNQISLQIDSSGNRWVWVEAPAEWRSALGLSVTSTAPTATNASGFTVSSLSGRKCGAICQVLFQVVNTNALTANTNYTIATNLSSAYRPSLEGDLIVRGAGNYLSRGYIQSSGNIIIRPNTNIPANTTQYFYAIYIGNY